MRQQKKMQEIRLKSFGSVIGLVFERGGAAEILMTFPELRRILNSWREEETRKSHPDQKTISALDLLHKKAINVRTRFVAEVPIAARRAKIIPVVE